MPSAARSRRRAALSGCAGIAQAAGSSRRGDPGGGDVGVDPRQHPVRAARRRRRSRAARPSPSARRAPSAPSTRPVTRTPWAASRARSMRPAAGELHRRLPPGGGEVGHAPGRLGGDAGGVQPGEDVAAAVAADHAHVPPDGQRHRPARGVDLLGELQARSTSRRPPAPRPRADRRDGGRLRGRSARCRAGSAAAKAGPAGPAAGAGRHHDDAGAPGAAVGLDAVAAGGGGRRRAPGAAEDRRGEAAA